MREGAGMRIRSCRSPMRSASGHAAAFFGRRSAAVLDANGFTLFPDPDDPALTTGDHATITPLLELDMEREYRDLRGFADRITRARMAGVLEACRRVATRSPLCAMRSTSAA